MADKRPIPLQLSVRPIDEERCWITIIDRETGEVAYDGELDMSEEWALKGIGHILEEGVDGEPVTIDEDWDSLLRGLGED
jgi:hypothetical protein